MCLFIYLFTILRAFPLYKAYMLGFGQVRRFDLKNFKRKSSKTMNKIKVIQATVWYIGGVRTHDMKTIPDH